MFFIIYFRWEILHIKSKKVHNDRYFVQVDVAKSDVIL